MTPTQLHELDVSIAKAMGKVFRDPDFSGGKCMVKALSSPQNGYVVFQPTRNPADAMEVLGWIMDRSDVAAILLDGTSGMYIIHEYYNDQLSKRVVEKTLPLAVSLFAERVINEK